MTSIIIALPYQLTSIFVLFGVFSAFGTMNGWSYSEVVFLGSIINFSTGCANGLFKQLRFLEKYIITGDLDVFMVRPRSIIFQLVTHEIDIFSIIGTAIPNLIIIAFCLCQMDILWTVRKAFLIVEMLIFGIAFWGCIFLLIGIFAFWIYKTNNGCMTLLYSVQDFCNYPINIYDRKIMFLLSCICPIAVVNYYPLLFLKDRGAAFIEIIMVLILVCFMFLLMIGWRLGLKRYQSTGS